MGDINRIDSFCTELCALWKKCPDVRFGQLIAATLGADLLTTDDKDAIERIRALNASQNHTCFDEPLHPIWKDTEYWNDSILLRENYEVAEAHQIIENEVLVTNYQALRQHLKTTGKKASELSQKEISAFINSLYPHNIDS